MLQDQEKADKASFKAALIENENTVSELIHFSKNNLNDLTVQCFTHKRFMSVQFFVDVLCQVYQELGVEGENGNISNLEIETGLSKLIWRIDGGI
ncbi:MAG: hypothetical protein HZC17_01685 [Candidatus Omnitrophica bacterium]|nr:hypothetical protein [Candidatus Omnitrophota bacterium]